MNDIEVDFTFPQDNIDVEPITEDDYDFNIFAVKGDKGDSGQDGQDGKGISSIVKTSTSGLVDTYTITYTDNTTSTFEVTNGQNGTNGQDGANGRDGVIQYTAGDNISIENNVISALSSGDATSLGSSSQYTQQNPLDFTNKETGIYIIHWNSNNMYIQASYNNTTKTKTVDKPNYNSFPFFGNMSIIEVVNKVTPTTQVASSLKLFILHTLYYNENSRRIVFNISNYNLKPNNISDSGSMVDFYVSTTNTDQTITSKKTFNTLPESSAVPTTNNQLVNKKYVDDNIGNINTILSTLVTLEE